MEKTFDQIEEKIKENFKKGDEDSPLVKTILTKYAKSVDAEHENFEQIETCRKFLDDVIIKIPKTTAFGSINTLIEKYGDAMRHPDSSPYNSGGNSFEMENLPLVEALVKHILAENKTQGQWTRSIRSFFSDGMLFKRILPDEKGMVKTTFLDRKMLTFDAKAEDVFHEDPSKAAKWSFEIEITDYLSAIEKYPDCVSKIDCGMPEASADEIENHDGSTSGKDSTRQDEARKNGEVVILHARCLSAPADMKYKLYGKTLKIQKGEPFEVKIAGGAAGVVYAKSGEEYQIRWPESREPYLPYVPYKTSKITQGFRVQSPVAKCISQYYDIEEMTELRKKNAKLAFDPIHLVQFSGKNSDYAEGFFHEQLRAAQKGKKLSNFFSVKGSDLVVNKSTMTPETMDPERVRNEIREMENDIARTFTIILDDTINQKDEKVGIRDAREIAENGNVSRFQDTNQESFIMEQKMILAQTMQFTPKFIEGDPMVEVQGKIKDFSYNKRFSQIVSQLDPSVLKLKWKFASNVPKGGLQAAAQVQNDEILTKASQMYPENSEVRQAHLRNIGSIVNSVNGTDSFNTDKAIEEDQAQIQAQKQAQQEQEMLAQMQQSAAPLAPA